MRTLIAIVALFLCATVSAAGIPSSASGVYLTPDRVCRVVFQRYQVSWIRADLTCLEFNGALSNAATVLYAPGEGSCWPDGAAIPFNPQSPVDYVTFPSFTGAVINALVGNQAAVINGGGVEQIWQRIAIVPSPAPYTCSGGSPPHDPHYARLCRQYGLYCGG